MGKSFCIWGNYAQKKAPYLCTRKPIDMKAFLTLAALLTAASCSAQNTQTPEINQNTTLPMNQTTITLNNGVVIPQFGLGVYSIPAGETTYNSVLAALKAAYRHIDTAHAYQNERSVGQAVKDSGIPREEIWITSKLRPTASPQPRSSSAGTFRKASAWFPALPIRPISRRTSNPSALRFPTMR